MAYWHETDEHYRQHDRLAVLNRMWPQPMQDYDDLHAYIEGRGLNAGIAIANGWYPSRDFAGGEVRIVIPAETVLAGHVYWQARAVSSAARIRYMSPKGCRAGAFVSVAPELEDPTHAVIVEGPMDALAAAECGWLGIAVMGMEPPIEVRGHVADYLKRRSIKSVLVTFDNEPLAQSNATHVAANVSAYGIRARVAPVRSAKDLAELPYRQRAQFFARYA